MEKEETIFERHKKWEEWDFETLIMIYRDLCTRWGISMFKNDDGMVIQELIYDMNFVYTLLCKLYFRRENYDRPN